MNPTFPSCFWYIRPIDTLFPDYIYSAGHSVWTYTLFSRGVIGIFCILDGIFWNDGSQYSFCVVELPNRNGAACLGFVSHVLSPIIAMWATLSESITRNPFDERLTGVFFGVVMALPQFFYNRAYYLKFRESVGQDATQLIRG